MQGPFGGIGAVVDQEAEFAILLHDVALPMADEDNGQVFGKLEGAVVTLPDEPSQDTLAEPECWVRAEIARAAESAIAQVLPITGDAPIGNVIVCLHRKSAVRQP